MNGAHIQSELPAVLTPQAFSEVPVLRQVEKRLSEAGNPQDVILWTQVRGEIIRQDELRKDEIHKRSLERMHLIYKMSFSIGAFAIGSGFVLAGLEYVGLFLIGAGLYGIAPDFVLKVFKKSKSDENEEN